VVLVLHTEVLVLVLQVWYCFVKNDLVTLVVIMILKYTATFQVLFIVSLFCAWNVTTVEINSGVHLLKKLNPPSALLLPVILVLVLLFWSWSSEFCLVYITGQSDVQRICPTNAQYQSITLNH